MPELRIYVDPDALARQMTAIATSSASQRYEHELDGLIDFVRKLDECVADMEFTRRLHKLTTELMQEEETGNALGI